MRGDVYLADLNPTRGAEQAGVRPVVLVQRDTLARFTRTVVVVPFTTNLRRTQVPGTVLIPAGEGGLAQDSVALCYQIVAIGDSIPEVWKAFEEKHPDRVPMIFQIPTPADFQCAL